MKYEVGDKVKIVAKKNGDNWNLEGYMDEWLGKTMTIAEVYYDHYSMEDDNGVWAWYEEMIECKAEEKEESRIEDALRRVKEMRKFNCTDVIGEIYQDKVFDCVGLECGECIINLLRYLSEEEPVKLTQFEYDLLNYYKKCTLSFGSIDLLREMKKKGYFKDVDETMKLSEILDNYEVIKDEE